jgi:hypothetical protein
MEVLDVQDKLEYARSAVAVLRALKIRDARMSYGDLARAIGLIRGAGAWEPWHRQKVPEILSIAAAVERLGGQSPDPLEFDRIVNESTGESGAGVFKNSRIVRE